MTEPEEYDLLLDLLEGLLRGARSGFSRVVLGGGDRETVGERREARLRGGDRGGELDDLLRLLCGPYADLSLPDDVFRRALCCLVASRLGGDLDSYEGDRRRGLVARSLALEVERERDLDCE